MPGHPGVFAAGDVAAVSDLTRPGQARPYKHHDLGFVVDLGGWQAVANPLGVRLSGPPAQVVTRGYHLLALPAGRLRVATDWIDGRLAQPSTVQFGLVPEPRLKP